MKFRYTIIYVDNVPNTLRFYQKAFGFEIGFEHESGDYGELVTGETNLAFGSHALQSYLGKTSQDADPKRPSYEIAFETDDVDAAYATAISAGATAVSAPKQMEWGQVISYVHDDNGVLIEICSTL